MPGIDPRVHVAHVALRVSDVPRSAAFYAAAAGLRVLEQDDERATLGAPAGGPELLRLRRAPTPGTAPRRATGLFHTAFLYPSRADLGATLRRVAEARIPITGASDHGVSEAIYLDDPDGIGIELYRDRPQEEWPAAPAAARVGMYSIPLDLENVLAAAGPDPGDGGELIVGHAHLKASDLPAAEAFWVDGLGFDLMQRFERQAAFVAAGGYHHHLGMNTWYSRGAAPEPPDGPGLDHVGLAYPDAEALADAERRLAAAGGAPPDGIGLELVLAPATRSTART